MGLSSLPTVLASRTKLGHGILNECKNYIVIVIKPSNQQNNAADSLVQWFVIADPKCVSSMAYPSPA